MISIFLGLLNYFCLRKLDSPTGADGFFYLKQIQSLSESFTFYYKDYSLAFLLPSLLNIFIQNPLISYHLAISIVFAGIFYFCSRILQQLGSGRLSLFLVPLFYFNNYFNELNFVFLKTATAVFFLLWSIKLYLSHKTARAILFFIFALLSHKIILVCGLIFLILFLFESRKRTLAAASLAALISIVTYLSYPRFFQQFVHLFSTWDLSKYQDFNLKNEIYILLATSILTSSLLFLKSVQATRKIKFIFRFFAVLLWLPILAPDQLTTNSVSYRLLLISIPFFIMSLAAAGRFFFYFVGCFVVLMNIHWNRPLLSWQNPWARRAVQSAEIEKIIPKNSLIYAPHGMEFYLAYATPFRPRSFLLPPTERPTYRVAYVEPYLQEASALKDDLQQLCVLKLSENYYLLKESDWILLGQIHQFVPHVTNMLQPKPDFVADYEN